MHFLFPNLINQLQKHFIHDLFQIEVLNATISSISAEGYDAGTSIKARETYAILRRVVKAVRKQESRTVLRRNGNRNLGRSSIVMRCPDSRSGRSRQCWDAPPLTMQ